ADRPGSLSRKDLDDHGFFSFDLPEKDVPEDKALETSETIQYSFDKHCSFSKWLIVIAKTIIPKEKGNALLFTHRFCGRGPLFILWRRKTPAFRTGI
ncbi:MAG: hypothetical protein M1313_08970, partial [Nitrospirae bacterium]|nr:hypothetical protein [Nitrospirota bacterium]